MENTKFLDGTRFLLALWVAIGHFYIMIGRDAFFHIPIIGSVILKPSTAVDGFILITGFLMMYHYIQRSHKEPPHSKTTHRIFWLRRFFRLYPVYILVVVVNFVIFRTTALNAADILDFFTGSTLTSWGTERTIDNPGLLQLLSHIVFLQGLIPSHTGSILGVTWSLSLEMQYYLLFPFLFIWLFGNSKKIKNRLILFFGLSVIIGRLMPILFGMYQNKGLFAHYEYASIILYKLPIFLLGMILALTVLKKISYNYLGLALICIMPFQNFYQNLVISFIVLFINLKFLKEYLHPRFYGLLEKLNSILSNRLSNFGANISYSLYLTHTTLIPYVIKLVIWISSIVSLNKYQIALISFPLFLVINFTLSHLIFNYIEKPFIQYGKKITNKLGKGHDVKHSA